MKSEFFCNVRGIYNNTMFARWWLDQLEDSANSQRLRADGPGIRTAVIARFIMCNDLSLATTCKVYDLPYMFWYPLWPRSATLAELARRRPATRRAVAHGYIVADYQRLYDHLEITPHPILYTQAKNSPRRYYRRDLKRRAGSENIDLYRKVRGEEKWRKT